MWLFCALFPPPTSASCWAVCYFWERTRGREKERWLRMWWFWNMSRWGRGRAMNILAVLDLAMLHLSTPWLVPKKLSSMSPAFTLVNLFIFFLSAFNFFNFLVFCGDYHWHALDRDRQHVKDVWYFWVWLNYCSWIA